MNERLKYYLPQSTQILIPNQLNVDKNFASKCRKLLIIIIIVSHSAIVSEALKPFFFQANNSISAVI
jgi:hypothetical protein